LPTENLLAGPSTPPIFPRANLYPSTQDWQCEEEEKEEEGEVEEVTPVQPIGHDEMTGVVVPDNQHTVVTAHRA
jgi:hypothetical protein